MVMLVRSSIAFMRKIEKGGPCTFFSACLENFRIRHHEGAAAGNIEVALIKLPIPAPRGLWLIAAVDFSDVVTLDVS